MLGFQEQTAVTGTDHEKHKPSEALGRTVCSTGVRTESHVRVTARPRRYHVHKVWLVVCRGPQWGAATPEFDQIRVPGHRGGCKGRQIRGTVGGGMISMEPQYIQAQAPSLAVALSMATHGPAKAVQCAWVREVSSASYSGSCKTRATNGRQPHDDASLGTREGVEMYNKANSQPEGREGAAPRSWFVIVPAGARRPRPAPPISTKSRPR